MYIYRRKPYHHHHHHHHHLDCASPLTPLPPALPPSPALPPPPASSSQHHQQLIIVFRSHFGKTIVAHENFHNWAKVIKQDLECDDRACQSFMSLFKKAPPTAPHGYMEACRVLEHIFKDKSKDMDNLAPETRNWSRFLQKACEEAIEDLEDPEHVQSLKHMRSSWNDWNGYKVAPPGPAGPSSSSSSWEPGGKGMGKDKDKGKLFQKGPRT
jgi:hypothetical protein